MRQTCAGVTFAMIIATVARGSAQSVSSQPTATPAQVEQKMETAGQLHFQRTTPPNPRQRPTRGSTRGQSLILTANVLGGYDDNVGATLGSAGTGSVPGGSTSGSTGLVDVMLEYIRRNSRRSIGIRTLGNIAMYPDYLDGPAPGAKARVFGTMELGRNNTLEASAQVRYEPFFTARVEDASEAADLAGTGAPPAIGGGVPVSSLFERRSWVSSNKAYLTRRWSPRDTTMVSYLYFAQQFTDDNESNHYHQAAASHSRRITGGLTLGASYQYLNGRYTNEGTVANPVIEQTVEGGPTFAKRFGRERQLSLSLRGGATSVEAIDTVTGEPYQSWAPSVTAAAAVDLTSAWRVSGGYSRKQSLFQGLTGQVYSTDAANVTAEGLVGPRTNVGVGGTFANGRTLVSSGATDTIDLYGAALQVRVSLTPSMAASAGYYLNYQLYSNPAALPVGYPAHYHRNAVFVGLTFWARLAGASPARARNPNEW